MPDAAEATLPSMRRMRLSLAALGWLAPAAALGAPKTSVAPGLCPPDFRQTRAGGCFARSDLFGPNDELYIHPKGWAVQKACLERYPTILRDLDRAWNRMDPRRREESGGCLGTYNPKLGAAWGDALWTKEIAIACPDSPPFQACGSTGEHVYRPPAGQPGRPHAVTAIRLNDPARCRFDHSENDAEMLFHETLHAVGFDNFPASRHNRSYNMEQLEFIKDNVYAATMLCFMGTKPALRKQVNYLQCERVVKEGRPEADVSLCSPEQRGFNADFSNAPQHMYVH